MRLENRQWALGLQSLPFFRQVADVRGKETFHQPLMTCQSSYCRVCGGTELVLVKPSNLGSPLTSDSFAITDSHYGVTAAIYRCANCDFLQCSDLPQVLQFYETLE